MKTWQKFEHQCLVHLIENYAQKYNIQFEQKGGSDSTESDIKINKSNSHVFIECKMSDSQCGQFVLIPNEQTKKFEYSTANQSKLNEYSQQIIDYMNAHFEEFNNPTSAGKDIELPKEIFYSWIKNYYDDKNTKFFMTNNSRKYIIFPINKFEHYFNVSAKYRIKKSGSSSPSDKNIDEIIDLLYEYGMDILKSNIVRENSHLFVNSNKNLHQKKLVGAKYTYLFVKNKVNKYEVRRLSNTYNANVIFSIHLLNDQLIEDLEEFIKFLEE